MASVTTHNQDTKIFNPGPLVSRFRALNWFITKAMLLARTLAALLTISTLALVVVSMRYAHQEQAAFHNMELPVGALLPVLEGRDIDGNPTSLSRALSSRTLLIVLSPTCLFCSKSWVNWDVLRRSYPGLRIVFADSSNEVTESFLAKHEIDKASLITAISASSRARCRLYFTPQVVLLDKTGRVERVWTGLFDKSRLAELVTQISK